jgi:hypothetical protein
MPFGRPGTPGRAGFSTPLAVVAAVLTLSFAAAPASAADADIGPKTFDLLVLRTLGTVQTAIGACLFVVAGPLSAPGGGWNEAWDVFVGTPFEDTFRRPLGSF